jgi:hypothetical protein
MFCLIVIAGSRPNVPVRYGRVTRNPGGRGAYNVPLSFRTPPAGGEPGRCQAKPESRNVFLLLPPACPTDAVSGRAGIPDSLRLRE